jgi:RNA polymerase sigma-70 factor, ECF subfamily
MKIETRIQDEWLALRCRTNDPGAYADLVAVMEQPLLYYALKITGNRDAALDILQEVWIRAFRGIRKLRDPSAIRPWLYRIVHGISIDYLRRRSLESINETTDEVESCELAAEESFSADDAAEVHLALDELQPAHREVLVLFFLEEFSIAEIAEATGCAEGTVKSRLYYAKKALRNVISRRVYGQHA